MKNYDVTFCPIIKADCKAECALYCDGKCALKAINEHMDYIMMAIGNLKEAVIDSSNHY